MGVSNYGILLIGYPVNDLEFPEWIASALDEDHVLYKFQNPDFDWPPELDGWSLGEPRGYERAELFGWYCSSPSYSMVEVNDFLKKASIATEHLRALFGIAPNAYIMNLQS